MIAYLLLAAGLLLIFLEFFLPGAVFGVIGGVLVVLSIVFFAMKATSALSVVLYIFGILAGISLLVYFTLKRMKKGKRFYLHDDQEGYMASSFEKDLLGKRGVALSDLKPAGRILIDSKQHQALSKTGYVEKGQEIEVIGGQGSHLIVKLVQK